MSLTNLMDRLAWFNPYICAAIILIFPLSVKCEVSSASLDLGSSISLDQVLEDVKRNKLFDHKQWLALLHYYDTSHSQADDPDFFISSGNDISPKNEMISLIHTLYMFPEQKLQCVFPARIFWLEQMLEVKLPSTKCKKLDDWKGELGDANLNLYFASSDLRRPASVFGHTFLHFSNPNLGSLLSPTANFAADADDSEGAMSVILGGLTGRYQNAVSIIPLHQRLKKYAQVEGRSLWRYPLDFTTNEIMLIGLHIWEVKEGSFDYYFIDENCAYRTLTALAVARPSLILNERWSHYALPIDTIRALKKNGLIKREGYVPSADSNIRKVARSLSREDREQAYNIAKGFQSLDVITFRNEEAKKIILSLAYDYLSLLILRGDQYNSDEHDRLHRIIQSRALQSVAVELKSDSNNSSNERIDHLKVPSMGHKSKRISLAYGREGQRVYSDLEFRLGYHEFSDPPLGLIADLNVSLLKLQYRIWEGGNGSLQRIDLLDIGSKVSNDRFFRNRTWALNLSRKRKIVNEGRQLVNEFRYAQGSSFDLSVSNVSVLLGGEVDYSTGINGDHDAAIFISAESYVSTQYFYYSLKSEYIKYTRQGSNSTKLNELSIGFSVGNNFRLFFNAKNEQTKLGSANEISAGGRLYF